MKNWRQPLFAGLALLMTGCGTSRDPASETPVELRPGEYKTSFTGSAMGMALPKSKGDAKDNLVCLTEQKIKVWPKQIVEGLIPMPPGTCQFESEPRVGNALKGKLTCPTDPKFGEGGSYAISYEGDLTETSTTLNTKIGVSFKPSAAMIEKDAKTVAQAQMGMALMSAVTSVVKIERVGDCP